MPGQDAPGGVRSGENRTGVRAVKRRAGQVDAASGWCSAGTVSRCRERRHVALRERRGGLICSKVSPFGRRSGVGRLGRSAWVEGPRPAAQSRGGSVVACAGRSSWRNVVAALADRDLARRGHGGPVRPALARHGLPHRSRPAGDGRAGGRARGRVRGAGGRAQPVRQPTLRAARSQRDEGKRLLAALPPPAPVPEPAPAPVTPRRWRWPPSAQAPRPEPELPPPPGRGQQRAAAAGRRRASRASRRRAGDQASRPRRSR